MQQNIFTIVQRPFLRLKDLLWNITARDFICIIILFTVSLLLRIPNIDFPRVTIFDEVIYANYAIHMIEHIPFMDIHPPLARMLFVEAAKMEPFTSHGIQMGINEPFDDFPFIDVRFFVSLFGILFPLIIYAIGRALDYTPRVALLLGLFIATDNAFIIYSRAILPDMFLVVFNFLAVLFAFLAVRSKGLQSHLYVWCSGIFVGLAISTKWTALALFPILALLYLLYRKLGAIIVFSAIACILYVLIFATYLMAYFPNGGPSDNFHAAAGEYWVAKVEFPKIDSMKSALFFLPSLHRSILDANSSPYVTAQALSADGAVSWPVARTQMIFWLKNLPSRQVTLSGNNMLWVTAFFVFLFDLVWIAVRLRSTKTLMVKKDELILLAGYAANYLPFLLIHRPMYLYHYFTALIFLILLLPKVTPRIADCLAKVTNDMLFAKVFIVFAAFLIFINFILILPSTYGF